MQWDGSQNAGFSTSPADKIYIPLDPSPTRPTVAQQESDATSQLNYVRGLLKLRKSAALGNDGGFEFLSDPAHSYPLIYMRSNGKEKYIIALNPSGKSVDVNIASAGASRAFYSFGTTESCSYKMGKNMDAVHLPATSAAVFRLE